MSEPVRLAIVGCGWVTTLHLDGYRQLFEGGCREFEVVACCDPNETNARERARDLASIQGSEPRLFRSVDELIGAGIAEAAFVCVPHGYHHSVAVPLMEAGLHVMVEKPIGITVKAGQLILETARKHQRILATAEDIRRLPNSRAGVWAINQRRLIGDVRAVHMMSIAHSPMDFTNPAFKWRGVKLLSGGGQILDSGAHFTDMVLLLFGDVDEVYCTMATYDTRMIDDLPRLGSAPADVETAWNAVIRFKSGLTLTWTQAQSFYGEAVSFGRFFGSEGTLANDRAIMKPLARGFTIVLANGDPLDGKQIKEGYFARLSEEDKDRLFPYGCTDGYGIEVCDFARAVAHQGPPEVDGHQGQRAKALCYACYESATAGKPVKVDAVMDGSIDTYQAPINEFWKI